MNSFDTLLLITNAMQIPYVHYFLQKLHDYYYPTYLHSIHVASTAAQVGLRIGKNEQELTVLIAAGLLHDIGKMNVPLSILTKPGVLSDEEFSIIQMHPLDTYTMLNSYADTIPDTVKLTGLMHHRFLDDSGYPKNILFERLPFLEEIKIITICDIFCAITSPRVYKKNYSIEYGLRELYHLAENRKVVTKYVRVLDDILHTEGLLLNIGQYEEMIITKLMQPCS